MRVLLTLTLQEMRPVVKLQRRFRSMYQFLLDPQAGSHKRPAGFLPV
jgi:hypothetical protein